MLAEKTQMLAKNTQMLAKNTQMLAEKTQMLSCPTLLSKNPRKPSNPYHYFCSILFPGCNIVV